MPFTNARQPFTKEFLHGHKIGVIDIGSNSIRLVVYDGVKRVPVPIFNEKTMCALGKGVAETGKLNPEGVKLAKPCMARLLTMVRLLDVTELHIIATAAVRDAKDGPEFIRGLEKEHQMTIRVISGEEEARLAGNGVISTIYKPNGIVGDLGGGSMELIQIDHAGLQKHTTLPVGPLRLMDIQEKKGMGACRLLVKKSLANLSWVALPRGRQFYAVGGSFRNIAHIHQERSNYPLRIIHQYTVSAKDIIALCQELQTLPPEQLSTLPVRSKRAPAIPLAALALEEALLASRATEVVFCASGIREGHLYGQLSPYVREEDPLVASCTDLSAHEGLRTSYARELFAWMEPLYEHETENQRRLRQAVCILSEIAWHMHPEYRASYSFERMLYSAIVGLCHQERVALAVALYCRYKYKDTPRNTMTAMLPEDMIRWAHSVGVAANLAFQLSGGMPGNLIHSRLSSAKKELCLDLSPSLENAMDDSIRKRLNTLANVIGA